MKYLIIPDVHNRCEIVEKIIKSVKPDKTIFLGDYFDDFYDNVDIIRDVANWFRHSVNQKNRMHLCGNHDLHYWFKDNDSVRCSGYDLHKSIAINDIVTKNDWEKLKFFHILDNKWLLSHAGAHPSWLQIDEYNTDGTGVYSLGSIKKQLKNDSVHAIKKFYSNAGHWFSAAGFSRSYSQLYGGLTWCDWRQEFLPIRGVHQLVGHTPCRTLYWIALGENDVEHKTIPLEDLSSPILTDKTSYNLCLDTHPGSQYYAIYESGALTIHKVSDLK